MGQNYLVRTESQEKARELRRQGWSLPQIAKEVNAHTGQVSLWVKGVEISLEAREQIRQKSKQGKEETLRKKINDSIKMTKERHIHHTKGKGDLAVAAVAFELIKQNVIVCDPRTEHAPFDLIGVLNNREVRKIQVKYVTAKDDKIQISLSSTWADQNGNHRKVYEENDFDTLAAYCPEPECVIFVPKDIWLRYKSCVTVRIQPPKNGANDYLLISDLREIK